MTLNCFIKKVLSIMLAFALCFVLFADFSAAKSKTVKLSAKKITLNVGKSKTITIKNAKKKATWKAIGKNKKLVKIKAKGKKRHKLVITAKKKAGTCYVQAKVGKKKLKCKVTIKAVKKTSKDAFVNSFSETAVRLLKESIKATPENNILLSPDSILTVLAMTGNGATGTTLSEMNKALGGYSIKNYNSKLNALHKRLKNDQFTTYNSANSIWYNKNKVLPKAEYLDAIKPYYDALVSGEDFNEETVDKINNWVKDNTKDMIPEILNSDSLSPEDIMALVNAVVFEGKWADPYSGTVNRSFTNSNGTKKSIAMLEGVEDTYLTIKGGTGFVKPYAGYNMAFVGLLPPKGKSANEYAKSLKGIDLANGYLNRKESGVKVYTRMPEFKYEYDISLVGALKNMGMNRAFSPYSAEFTNMFMGADGTDLLENPFIGDVKHKSFIELDKNGTKAAAATVVIMKTGSTIVNNIKKVYLDRPFVYAIIETKTGLPMFIGVVNNL